MKKVLLIVCAVSTSSLLFSQSGIYKKKPVLSINFIFNDFITPEKIRTSSLSSVLKDDTWSKVSAMGPGLAVSYFEGITNHLDFMASLGGSISKYNMKNTVSTRSEKLLLEIDANVVAKLLSDKYRIIPYVTGGVGISKYSVYWGAYLPIGLGVQARLGESTFLFTQMQYRVGISELTNNHINLSLGFGTPLTGKKN